MLYNKKSVKSQVYEILKNKDKVKSEWLNILKRRMDGWRGLCQKQKNNVCTNQRKNK